ncbi:DUF1802 family protein [bacterium]|nr:DUF1802 family protein [bacterium]
MILTKALKEWSSALKFYENKKVCLIFRKGGIHEKDFRNSKYLTSQSATYTGVADLNYFGQIIGNYKISNIDQLILLDSFHVWENSYLIDRFNFRPKNPLTCYLLDVFKIRLPKKIEYDSSEAKGCTSWFDLKNEVSVHSFDKVNDDLQVNKALKVLTTLY